MAETRLVIGGRAYAGWEKVSVTRSLEVGSGVFELTVSDRFAESARPIRRGDRCQVYLDTTVVLTGWVDRVNLQLTDETHSITVGGRDVVSDLINCSDDGPTEFYNLTLLNLAAALAAPFGIAVRAEVDVGGPFARVTVNPGQRAYELIEEYSRYRQVLPISDGAGALVLTRASRDTRAVGTIIEGENLLSGSNDLNGADCFSRYVVKGQGADGLGDLGGATGDPAVGEAQGEAVDKGVTRYRPLVIVADKGVDSARCTERAHWEAITRAARGEVATLTVQGWVDGAGQLWRVNTIVRARCPTLQVDGEYLVTQVTYSLTEEGGTTAVLTLMRPDAYQVAPEDEPQGEVSGFGEALGEEELAEEG